MASFIELIESQHAKKILVDLEEVTFIHALEKKERKTTIIHFTSSTYSTDRSIEVIEDYDTIKDLVIKARLLVGEGNK